MKTCLTADRRDKLYNRINKKELNTEELATSEDLSGNLTWSIKGEVFVAM